MQASKTVYFRDYPSVGSSRTGLTIPFSEADIEFFRRVEPLSSYNIRQIIGYDLFSELSDAAMRAESPISTFARTLLKEQLGPPGGDAKRKRQEGLQATFRGGKGHPLHDWYPYLEGYSPEFVSSVIKQFAPDAQSILDPFCGSGTTALVASRMGLRGLFCEVNPVCRTVIRAKAIAVSLENDARDKIADRLLALADKLPSEIKRHDPDETLGWHFTAAFGSRPFFDPRTFDTILRLRTMLDALAQGSANVGALVTVAVLRALVTNSLLVRRGDLRFRTASELTAHSPDLVREVQNGLRIISSDLLDTRPHTGSIEFAAENARDLAGSIGPVDAVVTSPPYLNGTNYFRNTKIELWFLRELRSKADLRRFRDAAITAGINDVTRQKSLVDRRGLPKLLVETIEALEEDAYDQRIPLMALSYFVEMRKVIQNLKAVGHENTKICIDLGDSCYGEVWVPTDEILSDLMGQSGFERLELITLRERQSRGGRKLRQTLQVFRQKDSIRGKPRSVGNLPEGWLSLRDELPHQRGDYARRNWGHPWHSMCSYQGKLKPSIAHHLVKALMPGSGGRLLDPFSGVGTIPLEARLLGHTAFGFDISPPAVTISRAKLEGASAGEVRKEITRLETYLASEKVKPSELEALASIRFNGPLTGYFHEQTLNEIVLARRYFTERGIETSAKALVMACLLHILHGNRPYALSRRSHPITPFAPTGPNEYRPLMPRLKDKIERSLRSSPEGPRSTASFQDCTATWPSDVERLDAIITSPPFFDSTRFYSANWMRLWFAGWGQPEFTARPSEFVDERQKKSFDVYRPIFAQAADRLRSGGWFAVHLGKSVKCDMAAELRNIGASYLELRDSFAESVEHCESHGIRDKGTVTHHQYLLFQKA